MSGILPKISQLNLPPIESIDTDNLGYTYLYDFIKGDFIYEDGRMVKVDAASVKGVQVWIEKVLRTHKFRWKIYEGKEYGTTIEDLVVGKIYPLDFIESELKREVTEALMEHPKIELIQRFRIEQVDDRLIVRFDVILDNDKRFRHEEGWDWAI